MSIDVSRTVLIPGDGGHRDAGGKMIECCCDECDYFLCCFPESGPSLGNDV